MKKHSHRFGRKRRSFLSVDVDAYNLALHRRQGQLSVYGRNQSRADFERNEMIRKYVLQ